MTTLGKTIIGAKARNVNQIRSSGATVSSQNWQEFAAGGKDMPKGNPDTAYLVGKRKEFDEAVKNVSGYVQNITRELNFTVDEELGRPIVTVLDQETGELIRQIAMEDMLVLAKKLSEAQLAASKGILFQGDA